MTRIPRADVRLWLLRLPGDSGPGLSGASDEGLSGDSVRSLSGDSGPGPLDAEERRRAAAFHRAEDRVRYVAAHTALREVLGEVTGRAPGELVFVREACPGCGEPHGRPALDEGPHFSLAHSGDLALIGVADAPVGVDVERTASARTVAGVLPRLHPGEQAEIRAAGDGGRGAEAFTAVWVRKEAWLKGIGIGLGRSLAADHVGLSGQPDGWTVSDVPAGPGYAAAVAVQGAVRRTELTDGQSGTPARPAVLPIASPRPKDGMFT